MINKNISIKNGIVNGLEVTLEHIITDEPIIKNLKYYSPQPTRLNYMPIILLLKPIIHKSHLNFSNLEGNLITLFPQTASFEVQPIVQNRQKKEISR